MLAIGSSGPRPDDFNRDLPESLGLGPDDIPLFQITRVVRRKGIETAIELVERMDDPRIKLIVTGAEGEKADVESWIAWCRKAISFPCICISLRKRGTSSMRDVSR